MGCSLCTLRKREEQYKLLYEIAQVNGKDLSKVRPEQAVEAFHSTHDPTALGGHGNPQEAGLADVCTQTDITFEHIMALAKLRPPTPPLPDLCPFLLSDSCHSLQTVGQEFYEGLEYLSHAPASGERAGELEYEEVQLCRLNSQEKLGLTLCYRTDEEEEVGIYVSEVGPNSIAARDGRVKEGDRILQINGQDLQNREEVETALSSEEWRTILLLVARPETQLEEGWLDEDQNQFLEELKMEMLEEQQKEEVQLTNSREEQPRSCEEEEEEEEEEITIDAATCSSNSQDRAGDLGLSSRISEPQAPSRGQTERVGALRGPDSSRSPGATRQGGRQRFRQRLELKCRIGGGGGEGELSYSRRCMVECSLEEQEGVQRELRLLSEELRSIERECQSIMEARRLRPNPPAGSDRDSSSAYDTAESGRSTPLGPRRPAGRLPQSAVSAANHKNLSRTSAGRAIPTAFPAKPGPEEASAYEPPIHHANIPVHARHYQSYMQLVQQRAAVEAGHSQLSLAGEGREPQRARPRPEGQRCTARRAARDRLLRERALKIREERGGGGCGGGGTTTDDDAASELKLGRYWSREERKQHLLRAKEQRRRREFMMRSRLESLREGPQSGGEGGGGRREVSILELSHRKMMKKRSQKILDNWMTIQELMSHGARTPEDPGMHSAFLSVTTV